MSMSGWCAVQWWIPGAISCTVLTLPEEAVVAQSGHERVGVAGGRLVVDVEAAGERGDQALARGAPGQLVPEERSGLVRRHIFRRVHVERDDLALHLAPLEGVAAEPEGGLRGVALLGPRLADEHRLGNQLDADLAPHARGDLARERQQLRGGAAAAVGERQRVLARHRDRAGAAVAAGEAGALDEPRRRGLHATVGL